MLKTNDHLEVVELRKIIGLVIKKDMENGNGTECLIEYPKPVET